MSRLLPLLLIIALVDQTTADDSHSFTLPASDGRLVEVAAGRDTATVVWFTGAECPMAKLYGPRMSRLAEEFATDGVQFVGVDSNRQDSLADIERYVRRQSVTLPVVRDEGNVIADSFGATRTPEVFLLDRQLRLVYRGRIDDQYTPGVTRSAPEREDLRVAITQLLAGEPITVAETKATGCFIGKVTNSGLVHPAAKNDITFSRHISRLLQSHCMECHREGEIGPFAMQDFDEVVGWASTMLETIENGRMPPWGADPEIGHFANARGMSEADKQLFRDWIAGGMKQGDAADLPEPLEYVTGWQLSREPDLVIPMRNRPFHVPAEGTVEYQYFVADPQFTEDQWVIGAQIIPGARSVVHHAIAFLRPPDGVPLRGIGWLTAYVPGQRLTALPPGYARKIPAGSRIVFQMHYTTSGQPQDDITSIGLVLADAQEVTHQMITLIGIEQEFEIPPHAPEHRVTATLDRFPRGGRLLGVAPHMHYRGKSFQLQATGGGETTTLLQVPHYDFNWQHTYEFADPLPLDDVEKLELTATFDNSSANPFNPNPDEWVTWGDQTWEEMAVAFFDVAEPLTKSTPEDSQVSTAADSRREAARQQKVAAYVDRVFRELDADNDGRISKSEGSIVVRHFNFYRFDRDQDGVATREEVEDLAETLF